MSDYTFDEKTRSGYTLIDVLKHGVFQRRASGGDRDSAMAALKSQLIFTVEEGRKAQEILEELAEKEKESAGA